MLNINQKLFSLINNLAGSHLGLDNFFVFLTTTGFNLVIVFVVVYLFFIIPFQKTNPAERLRAWGQAILITTSAFITWALVWYIKVLAMAPRPFEILTGVHQLVEETYRTSFPSNHAALSMALAISVYFYHKRLGVFLFIIALLVCFSRIYVGVHFPIDVLVGALIGIAVPFILFRVFRHSDI